MKVKVICLNLWWTGDLLPIQIEFLRQQDADILLLQEVYGGKDPELEEKYRPIDVFQEKLGYPYADYAQALIQSDSPKGLLPEGNAVISKLPIVSHSTRFLVEPTKETYRDIPEDWPIFPRVLQHAKLEKEGLEINAFNFHGVWDMDGDRVSPDRQRMSEIIIEETSDRKNVILAGDSNAKVNNPAMRAIEEHLKNAFVPDLKTTFNMRRKDNPGYATAPVDVFYVSPNIEVVSAECPDVDVSDHLPLVVTLDIT